MRKDHTQPGETSPEHGHDHGEAVSNVLEKAQDLAESWKGNTDDKVVHCPMCYGAQQSEKYMKAATVFSLGAFVISIVALALPFLRSNTDHWEQVLTTLQTLQESVGAKSSSAPVVVPIIQKTSSRASQAAAARSSATTTSSAASSEAPASSSSAPQEASSSSSADGSTP